jgi:hypothetical protein
MQFRDIYLCDECGSEMEDIGYHQAECVKCKRLWWLNYGNHGCDEYKENFNNDK